MIDNNSLKYLNILRENILEFGFQEQNSVFTYSKKILNDEFILKVEIKNNVIKSTVIETVLNERFVLYDVEGAHGSFVAQMRKEYNDLIDDIKEKCCKKSIFKTQNANLLIEYAKDKYGDNLEHLWDKFPQYAVLRNSINNKWYATIMIIKNRQLGIDRDGEVEVVNVSLPQNEVEKIIDNKRYYKAFHMNKKYWITVLLDSFADITEVYKLLDISYNISISKSKKCR